MCSAWDNAALPTLGFPIRASAGQWLFSASPRLIAAVHALLLLLVPRHPPCALNILTVIRSHPTAPYGGRRADPVIPVFQPPLIGAADVALSSFQGPRRGSPTSAGRSAPGISARLERRRTPVSQNSTACWTVTTAPRGAPK